MIICCVPRLITFRWRCEPVQLRDSTKPFCHWDTCNFYSFGLKASHVFNSWSRLWWKSTSMQLESSWECCKISTKRRAKSMTTCTKSLTRPPRYTAFVFVMSLDLSKCIRSPVGTVCLLPLQDLQSKRTAIEAFGEIIRIFEEECETQERYCKEYIDMFLTLDSSTEAEKYASDCQAFLRPHRRACNRHAQLLPSLLSPLSLRIPSNSEELQSRVEEIHSSKKRLEEELRTKALAHMEIDKKMNCLKPDLMQLRRIRDQYLL